MHVDFYFDFLSPYSFIASKLIQKQPWYPSLIKFKPVSLPIIMTKSENKSPASVPAKLAWMRKDMKRTALMNGFEMKSPASFPFSVKYLNAAIASLSEEQKSKAVNFIYDKVYGQGHFENNEEEHLQSLLKEGAGIELGNGWFERGWSEVTANSEEALKKGAFGVPTFVLYKDDQENGELFWGSDRIDQLSFFISSKISI